MRTLVVCVILCALASPGGAGAPPGETVDGRGPYRRRVEELKNERGSAEAEVFARNTLDESTRTAGPASLETADALDALVYALMELSKQNDPETLALAEKAVRIKEGLLQSSDLPLATSLMALSRVQFARGDYQGARTSAQRAADAREITLGPDNLELARSISNVATAATRQGDLPAARRSYERVLKIFDAGGAPDYPDRAIVLNNLGSLLKQMGDLEAARPVMQRAVALQEAELGPEGKALGGSLGNLCNLMRRLGDLKAARSTCERSLAIWEKDPGPDTTEVAIALQNLGHVLIDLGQPDAARPLVERAIANRTRHGQTMIPEMAAALNQMGDIAWETGDVRVAKVSYQRGVEILGKILPSDHPDLAEPLQDLARARWRIGERSLAWNDALRSMEIWRANLRRNAAGLSEREALRLEQVGGSSIDLLVSMLLQEDPAADQAGWRRRVFDEMIRSRAMVLDEIASRHRALTSASGADLAPLGQSLAQARVRLSQMLVAGPPTGGWEAYAAQVRRAQDSVDEAERELGARSASFNRTLTGARIDLASVSAALPGQSALIAYRRYETQGGPDESSSAAYVAFVLRGGRPDPVVVNLGPADRIDELIRSWRAAAGANPAAAPGDSAEAKCREIGEKLRAAIWDRAARKLNDARMIFVVPDASVNFVNFSALPGGSGKYLLETGPMVHYLSAERDLVRARLPVEVPRNLLALGGPDFDQTSEADDTEDNGNVAASHTPARPAKKPVVAVYRSALPACFDQKALLFPDLPMASDEARDLGEIWSRSGRAAMVLTGPSATEARFKSEASGYATLHLATHGFSAVGLCAAPTTALPRENPLLLSGLVLAGANHRGDRAGATEDGILTAEEIASLDLSSSDLVTLSACETGLGHALTGEGVLGLRRAFDVAGAGTLIMSLWKVEDAATRVWMQAMYSARLEGASTVEAVRHAGLDIIARQRRLGRTTHPFYWGAFVAAGDWR